MPHPSVELLKEATEVLEAKAHDYASSSWDDNFTGTAKLAGVSVETVFHVMVGIKVMRLESLLGGDKEPLFESVDDTLLDLQNYVTLWRTYIRQEKIAYDQRCADRAEAAVE